MIFKFRAKKVRMDRYVPFLSLRFAYADILYRLSQAAVYVPLGHMLVAAIQKKKVAVTVVPSSHFAFTKGMDNRNCHLACHLAGR